MDRPSFGCGRIGLRSMSEPTHEMKQRLAALQADVTAELRAKRTESAEPVAAEPAKERRRRGALGWLLLPVRLAMLLVLPFFVLVGGGVWLYRVHDIPTWLALGGSGAVAAALLTLYGARISKKLTGKARLRLVGTKLAAPVIVFYCGYALLFLSSVNAKTDEVREYYRSIHPLLRVALSTAILADRDIVVTDARREPADYAKMGLPTLDNSLHFVQPDGFVHAVDLRTIRRSEWRNRFLVGYFRLMGLKTLRHVGTADHLHVSLAPPGDRRR